MAERVHGHEVKRMVMEAGNSHSRESLVSAIIDKFGEETRFYSCAADNMTADELIAFFENNGKLNQDNYTFFTGPGHTCSH